MGAVITGFYQFYLNTKVLFQPGISQDFSNELDQMKAKKFLLICDPFFATSGVAEKIQKGVEEGGGKVVGQFSEVPPNSELRVVERCAALAKDLGAEGIIALGGGSAMDTAKAANITFSLGGNLVEDFSGTQTITTPLNPLIAIPTTSGTGSEVTSSAVILDEENNVKLSFNDFFLRPTLALLDPELTLTVPPKVTAMTGMDAMTHAVEAITSLQANPMSEALAMKAVQLIKDNVVKAIQNPDDLEVRSNMMIAANMAGIAFDHAMVGVVHAMAHATGGIAHVPHGAANSIFLPLGMEYNMESCAERYGDLARRFGIDTRIMSTKEAAQAAIQFIRQLRAELKESAGLPDKLRDWGVKEEQLEAIAEAAVDDGTVFFNPREVTFEEILPKIKEAF